MKENICGGRCGDGKHNNQPCDDDDEDDNDNDDDDNDDNDGGGKDYDGNNDDGDDDGGREDEGSRQGRGDGDGCGGGDRCRRQVGGSVSNRIRALNDNDRHGSGGDDGRYHVGVGGGGRGGRW